MKFRKMLLVATAVAGTLGAVAVPTMSHASSQIHVNFAPPALRHEFIPPARYGFVWLPGYWDFRGRGYVWVAGHYVPARAHHVYQPHRWVQHGNRWVMTGGRWDRDRDGVPDRFDRHPNNPNRR